MYIYKSLSLLRIVKAAGEPLATTKVTVDCADGRILAQQWILALHPILQSWVASISPTTEIHNISALKAGKHSTAETRVACAGAMWPVCAPSVPSSDEHLEAQPSGMDPVWAEATGPPKAEDVAEFAYELPDGQMAHESLSPLQRYPTVP